MILRGPVRRAEAVYAGLVSSLVAFGLGVGLPRLVGLWEDEASHGKILMDWMRYGLSFSGTTRGLWKALASGSTRAGTQNS